MQVARLSLVMSLVSTMAFAQALHVETRATTSDPLLAARGEVLQGLASRWTDKDGCPLPNIFASAVDVFHARFQALITGDIHTLSCFYAKDATVILPGSIVQGRAQITAAFMGFGAMFGGAQPQLTSVTGDHFAVLATFTMTGPELSIPDGADTYVVVGGRIVYQTVHSTVVPTAPAP